MPHGTSGWRVLRGTDFADGRRIEAGSHVEKLDADEAALLEAKGAIQPFSDPGPAPMPAPPVVDLFEPDPPLRQVSPPVPSPAPKPPVSQPVASAKPVVTKKE